MKKSIFLVLTVLLVAVWGYFALDAYLCSHLYYWWSAFTTCSGGQWEWLNMLWTWKNWSFLIAALGAATFPIGYLFIANRKISLTWLFISFVAWTATYMLLATSISKSLLGSAWLIQIFHVVFVFALLAFFLIAVTALWDILFKAFRRRQEKTIHGIFLRFTIGLIAFCVGNVFLLMVQAFFGITVWLEVLAWVFLLWKQKSFLKEAYGIIETFVQNVYNKFTENPTLWIAFFLLITLICVYVFMWFNLAFIPYSTAWDANHAYLFFPRAWALNNGLYRGASGATSTPYLWYGFLTFWFKLASSFFWGSGMFGMSPDWIAVLMNFWSGPLVLIAFVFLLDAFISFLNSKNTDGKKEEGSENSIYTRAILCIGLFLMILWLSSWMWAFLVFIDNKTDLAVMFFSILALYVWIQFVTQINGYVRQVEDKNSFEIAENDLKQTKYSKKNILHFAILSGILFAASAVAKPTGMFDFVNFGILLLMQRQVLLFGFGTYTLILWALGLTQMMLVGRFLSIPQSWVLVWVGLFLIGVAIVYSLKKKGWKIYLRYVLIWAATILAWMIIYKAPFVIINNIINRNQNIPSMVRSIFLGQNTQKDSTRILLASNVSMQTLEQIDAQEAVSSSTTGWSEDTNPETGAIMAFEKCIATPTDKNTLYSWLKEGIWSAADEDLGRYVGYGWKTFSNNFFTILLPKGCYSLFKDAKYFCENELALSQLTFAWVADFLQKAPQTERVVWWLKESSVSGSDIIAQNTLLDEIKTFVQSNSIQKFTNSSGTQINIPYKYIIPFNVTFNWSLQNLSSYYTDIGIMWLLWLGIVILGLLYGIFSRKRQLAVISLVTLGAWATWWLVGSWIVWYSLWLIVWTILGIIAYFYYMYRSFGKKTSLFDTIFLYLLAGVFLFFALIQLVLNFVRIGSQGGSWPFAWYKWNVWEKYVLDNELQWEQKQVLGYSAKDVFDLQFPHYNPILSKVNGREKGEWVVVAWTYLQYFINDQNNVSSDGFLTEFRKSASDNNVCNTYKRLVDKKTKYFLVDPNIASVVMWGWNSTLLDRFFAVLGPNDTLLQHGALTMLQALVQGGYLELVSTNSLVTKYAFVASDDELSQLLNVPVWDALLIERARMSAARFFPKVQQYANVAAELLSKRIQTLEWIEDIANALGKEIDQQKVVALAKEIVTNKNKNNYSTALEKIGTLTDDEKATLQYFLSVYQSRTTQPENYRQYITNLITSSFSAWSQVMAFIVK